MTNFNERTNTHLYKIISHTLFSKGLMLVVCEIWVGDGDRVLHIDPSSSGHSSTSFSSWLGCSTVGHCLPLVLNSASCPQLTQAVCVLVIFLFDSHLLPLIYTGAFLDWRLGRGSICYMTILEEIPIYFLRC